MTVLSDRRDDQIEIWTPDGLGRDVREARKYADERARAANLPAQRIVISVK